MKYSNTAFCMILSHFGDCNVQEINTACVRQQREAKNLCRERGKV